MRGQQPPNCRLSGHTDTSAVKQCNHPAGHMGRQRHVGGPLRPQQAQGKGAPPLLVGRRQAARRLRRLGRRAFQRRWQGAAQAGAGRRHQLPFSISQRQVHRHAISNEGPCGGARSRERWQCRMRWRCCRQAVHCCLTPCSALRKAIQGKINQVGLVARAAWPYLTACAGTPPPPAAAAAAAERRWAWWLRAAGRLLCWSSRTLISMFRAPGATGPAIAAGSVQGFTAGC